MVTSGANKTMPKTCKITFNCSKCNKKYTVAEQALRQRTNHKGEYICYKCLIRLRESSRVFGAIPEEFHHQLFKGYIDRKIAVKYLKGLFSKVLVRYKCRKCKRIKYVRWDRFSNRKHFQYEDICQQCSTTLINNQPSMLQLNRNTSKSLWHNPDYRLKCLKAFEQHNKMMQMDPEYAFKHRRRSRSVSGHILINNQTIKFDSAYELIFLWQTKDKYLTIRRCGFAIAYNGHFYHPDFLVVSPNGDRIIIEIKGYYQNNVVAKQKAAEQYIYETRIADSYILCDTDMLIKQGILRKVGSQSMWKQIKEINSETVITFADPKHKRIAEIGPTRFRREIKNQKKNETPL